MRSSFPRNPRRRLGYLLAAAAAVSGCTAGGPAPDSSASSAEPDASTAELGVAGVVVLQHGLGVGLVAFGDSGTVFIQCGPTAGDQVYGYPASADPTSGTAGGNTGDVTVTEQASLNIGGAGAAVPVSCTSDTKVLPGAVPPDLTVFFTADADTQTSPPAVIARDGTAVAEQVTPPASVAGLSVPEACDELATEVATLLGDEFAGDALPVPLYPCTGAAPSQHAAAGTAASSRQVLANRRRPPAVRR